MWRNRREKDSSKDEASPLAPGNLWPMTARSRDETLMMVMRTLCQSIRSTEKPGVNDRYSSQPHDLRQAPSLLSLEETVVLTSLNGLPRNQKSQRWGLFPRCREPFIWNQANFLDAEGERRSRQRRGRKFEKKEEDKEKENKMSLTFCQMLASESYA